MNLSVVGPPMIRVNDIQLGCFVADIEDPKFDRHNPAFPHPPKITIDTRLGYTGSQHTDHVSKNILNFTRLLSSVFSKRINKDIDLSAQCTKTYALDNARQCFEVAVRDPSTRQWLLKSFDSGDDVFFLSGVTTLTGTTVTQGRDSMRERGGQATAPVGAALAAAGLPSLDKRILDSGVEVLRSRGEQVMEQYEIPEEVIVKFQYRKLRYRYFFKKHLDKVTLEKKAYWQMTEQYMSDEDELDSIEVYFADEDWHPEGDWYQVEGGAFFAMGPDNISEM